jgi:hypothetical protein
VSERRRILGRRLIIRLLRQLLRPVIRRAGPCSRSKRLSKRSHPVSGLPIPSCVISPPARIVNSRRESYGPARCRPAAKRTPPWVIPRRPAVRDDPDLHTDHLRPDDRRRVVVDLLAAGLCRLRDLDARTAAVLPSVFQPDSTTSSLEPVPPTVTVQTAETWVQHRSSTTRKKARFRKSQAKARRQVARFNKNLNGEGGTLLIGPLTNFTSNPWQPSLVQNPWKN